MNTTGKIWLWLLAGEAIGCVVIPPDELVSEVSSESSGAETTTAEGGAVGCVEAPSKIIGRWSAEGHSPADTVGRADGLPVGAVGYGDEVPDALGSGKAFTFSDEASTIVIDNRPSLQVIDGDFTVALWARLDAFESSREDPHLEGTDAALVSKMESANAQGWRILFQGGAATFWFCFGTGNGNGCQRGFDTLVEATVDVELHRWYAIAGVKNGDEIRMYVDGVLQGSSTMTNYGFADTADLRLASWLGRDGLEPSGAGFLTGALDDVMLFERALTDLEIEGLATQPVCAP